MHRYPRPYLALMFVLVMVTIWYARNPPDPTASRALLDSRARLEAYYRETPPAGGWTLDAITARDRVIWVDIRPPGGSGRFGKLEFGERERVLAAFCPGGDDLVWRLLARGQSVEVRALGADGSPPTAAQCHARRP